MAGKDREGSWEGPVLGFGDKGVPVIRKGERMGGSLELKMKVGPQGVLGKWSGWQECLLGNGGRYG